MNNIMEKIVFYILALIMIVSAIASVTSRQMLRSVIYLLFVLIGIAGLYFLIDYNFLAAVQLTVYAGGIIVLVIFSVLLVHHIEMELEMAKLSKKIITALTIATLFPVYILIEIFDVGYMDIYFYTCLIILIFFLLSLWKANTKKQFIILHNVLKFLIVAGVFCIILINPSVLWNGIKLLFAS